MSADGSNGDLCPIVHRLSERCRAFGLPVWCLDAAGRAAHEPRHWGDAERWLASPGLRERIVEAGRRGPPVPPRVVELFPGCWMLPIAGSAQGTRSAPEPYVLAAMALGPEVVAGDAFLEICRAAGLDPGTTRAAVARLGRYERSDLDQVAEALGVMHGDLAAAAGRDEALSSFSCELAHAYEQISLLYKLGRSMNWLTKPHEFMQTACNLLLGILDFSWVAVRYSTSAPGSARAGVSVTMAGSAPCSRKKFEAQVNELLARTHTDHWRTLLEPDQSAFARLVGSQVIAEPVLAGGRVVGLLLAGNKTGADPDVTSIETQLLDATAEYLGAFLHNVALYAEQREMFLGTIRALTAAIDAKDRYTRGHSERVALVGSKLALSCGMSKEQAERVRIAGLVHDVGKIGIPEAVLRKPGRLTDAEFEQIKQHPVIGHRILQDIAQLRDVLPGVLYHHERWDGRGYPERLAGDRIPYLGRMLAVADAFDAMSSDRSYRPGMPRERVLADIAACSATQFDPELAAIFVTLDLSEYDAMVARHVSDKAEAA